MEIKNEVLKFNNRFWLVREAVSEQTAIDCIAMSSVTGSVGGKDCEQVEDGELRVLADVVEMVERRAG